MSVKIISTGSFLGKNIVTNHDLFDKIHGFDINRAKETLKKKGNDIENLNDKDLFDLWIKQVCGVEKRVFFEDSDMTDKEGPTQFTEYMGYMAGKNALINGGIDPTSIEHVIFCSYTPNQLMPNPACLTAHYLKMKDASGFHMNTACSSFLDGLGVAYMMIKSGEYKRILVVAADLMSKNMDMGDITTAILFGDGASAAILEESNENDSGVLSFASMTNYNNEMLNMDYGKPIRMEGGPLVQRNAVNAMYTSLEKALLKAGMNFCDIDYLIPHQANLRILQRLADKIKIPYEKTLLSVVSTGNVSGASIGIGFDWAFRGKTPELKFKKGDILGLTTVGGGYTFSGMVYKV